MAVKNQIPYHMEEKEIFHRAYIRFCIKHSLPIEKVETFGRLLLPDGF
jgi:hypothetical protein